MTGWQPGDRRPDPASMLRVNQAGEYGATRIYAGPAGGAARRLARRRKLIARMAARSERHLDALQRADGRAPGPPDRCCSRCGTSPASRSARRPR